MFRRSIIDTWPGGLLACCLTLSFAHATEDLVIQVPDGWITDVDAAHAASPTANAIVAWWEEDGHTVRSMIIQTDLDGTRYTNVFDGVIGWLEYAPDGSSLLANRSDSARLGVRLSEKILLDDQGHELWSVIDGRSFHYSTTGEVLWAWGVQGKCSSSPSKEIEILDLELTSLRMISRDPAARDVQVIGTGDRVLLSTGNTLLSLDTTGESPVPLWTVTRPQDPILDHFSSIEMLDDDHLAWPGKLGKITIVNIEHGRRVYEYDPVALAEKDLQRDDTHYFRYQFSRGPKRGTLTMFDGTSEALILDLESGKITSESIDTSLPGEQFELGRWALLQQRLFLISPGEARVRPLR